MNLTVFTCCDGKYKSFIPLFISSLLAHESRDIFVEIGVDAVDDRIKRWTDVLGERFGNRFLIREVDFKPDGIRAVPSAIRFLTEPDTKSQFIYIADVDIIFLECGICDKHLAHMVESDLPFSNAIRQTEKNFNGIHRRLRGCHFTPFEKFYPLPKLSEIPRELFQQDEALLYHLATRIPVKNLKADDSFRIEHGIHFTTNRLYENHSERWGVEPWAWKLCRYLQSPEFVEIMPFIDGVCAEQLLILMELLKSHPNLNEI